ncbi:MAG: 2-deoxy-D-gluconate 3-dehydrogenase [Proteiniphilum acetatigenes]|uniref:2-deoxy-D-gluconate 3-dehydrogenase n=1 Tax=Proteiniphilum acetatigenes TaxID=294710 RepID=A0A124FXR3_9BACT|nr:MAG: 2-deoxy-D-gluconate 3-dehydrogenase [Proteiniphilum acetatigenes]
MILDDFRLDGRMAVVTGCRRGIGKAMAIALAQAGANIIGVSANLSADGGEVGKEIRKTGRTFAAYACDFSDRTSLYHFLDQVKSNHPVIDILVNNAGTIRRREAENHSDEDWDEVIAVNTTASFILTREIGKMMIQKKYGKIIFTASLLTFQGGIRVPGYAASKGAVGQLVKAFANEWAPYNIRVNAIAPGYIATDNTYALRMDTERNRAIRDRIPVGRWGNPEDLAGAIVFLASEASHYITGIVLPVDGGWLAR